MIINRKCLKNTALSVCLLLGSSGGYSAELDISDMPLYLDNAEAPNVLLVLDDSGSMDSEVLISNAGQSEHPGDDDEVNSVSRTDPNSELKERRLCVAYNVLAFDPSVTYTPWAGVNKVGTAYSDRNLSNALVDPYEGTTTNISSHYYTTWVDVEDWFDGFNGSYDDDECETAHSVNSQPTAVQENYANWYSYYRSRKHVTQKAALAIIDTSTFRMGLGTMNNNGSVGTRIKEMDDGDDSTTQDATDKRDLQTKVAKIHADGTTPTNYTLGRAGMYYKDGSLLLFGDNSEAAANSPIQASTGGACQRNFTILMSDGYADPITGTQDSKMPLFGNADGSNPGELKGDTDYDGGYYADNNSKTLADIAMYYYENDISDDLADNVNGEHVDMHQHMETYTVAFGVKGNLSCNPTTDSTCACLEYNPETFAFDFDCHLWPSSIDKDATSIDDMTHAAYNGRGLFLNASDPQALIDQLQTAMNTIRDITSSSAAVAASSTSLTSDTVIFQAHFNTADWHGNLRALPVSTGVGDTRSDCATTPKGSTCSDANWNAMTVLNDQNYNIGRVILTTEGGSGAAFRSSVASGDSADEVKLTNYLRGDRSNEVDRGGVFRNRNNSVLGDIINSAPAFVKAPRFDFPDDLETTSYESYKTAKASRAGMIYVGANDGMLHGFDESTGEEKIAYVPSMVGSKMLAMSTPNYSHKFMVDGSPTVGDVFYDSAWHSVLVSGLRYGGQSIFALDVSTPANFIEANASSIVLWEYTDADLGYTYSRPDIVRLNNGTWAAIFGNGYNNTEGDGSPSTTGHAYLYIVNIKTGALIRKIDTDAGTTSTPNGLATVTPVDADGDYDVDYIYAGDLLGNLWKFDLRSETASTWSRSVLFTTNAVEAGHPAQPITTRPSVAFHPDASKEGVIVYFGTGRYIDISDKGAGSQNTQTFYGIWDDWSGTAPPTFSRSGTHYVKQTILNESNGLRAGSDHAIDWSIHHGWYLDLVNTADIPRDNQGERQTTNSIVRGDRIIFTTLIPNTATCGFGGESWLMELDMANGGSLTDPPLDINDDGQITTADVMDNGKPPTGMKIDGLITQPTVMPSTADTEYKIMSSSTGSTTSVAESPPTTSGGSAGKRQSWIEISQ